MRTDTSEIKIRKSNEENGAAFHEIEEQESR
jgi:hypothetical protein